MWNVGWKGANSLRRLETWQLLPARVRDSFLVGKGLIRFGGLKLSVNPSQARLNPRGWKGANSLRRLETSRRAVSKINTHPGWKGANSLRRLETRELLFLQQLLFRWKGANSLRRLETVSGPKSHFQGERGVGKGLIRFGGLKLKWDLGLAWSQNKTLERG